jgi:hypothetical protein
MYPKPKNDLKKFCEFLPSSPASFFFNLIEIEFILLILHLLLHPVILSLLVSNVVTK